MTTSQAAGQHGAPARFFSAGVEEVDPEIFKAIQGELGRQRHEVELIASENIVSRAVLEAQGSVLTNKYAEGYPGRRYYGGCQWVDGAEQIGRRAREHVRERFLSPRSLLDYLALIRRTLAEEGSAAPTG